MVSSLDKSDPEQLLLQAEKLVSVNFFKQFFSGGPDYDEAISLCKKAAITYKGEQKWSYAAKAFEKAAEYAAKNNDDYNEAQNLFEAAECILKYDSDSMPDALIRGCRISDLNGRASISGRMWKNVADIFISNGNEESAMICFKNAAASYELDVFSKTSRSMAIIQYAELLAKHGDIEQSITIFEDEGRKASQNTNTQYNAKEYFLKAAILIIALGDGVRATESIKRYGTYDQTFKVSREGQFILSLANALENDDIESFEKIIAEFDKLTKIDFWKMNFLAMAQQHFSKSNLDSNYEINNDKSKSQESQIDLT